MVLVYAFKAEHVQASSLKYLLGTCWHIFLTLFMWLLFMNIEKISYYQNNLKSNQCKQKKNFGHMPITLLIFTPKTKE